MAGLLLELRRQIAHGRKKSSHETVQRAQSPTGRTAVQQPPVPEERTQEDLTQQEHTPEITQQEHTPEITQQEHIQERNSTILSKEDFLLSQIDEFRERARQLQSLLDSRESEAQELQSLVDERQEQADALGEILKERQEKADGFSAEIEKQIDVLIDKVAAKMEEIEASMKADVADGQHFSEEKAQELKESLAQIEEQLTAAKTELSDKVHSENVKCYRNIADLFRSMEERIDGLQTLDQHVGKVKVIALISMITGFINLVGMVMVALIGLGVITF